MYNSLQVEPNRKTCPRNTIHREKINNVFSSLVHGVWLPLFDRTTHDFRKRHKRVKHVDV